MVAKSMLPLSNRPANLTNREITAEAALNDKTEVLSLTINEELAAGSKATLFIEYDGEINDKMAGFYRSVYNDKASGEKK